MCFSAKESFTTYAIGVFLTMDVLVTMNYDEDTFIAMILLLYVLQMQLADGMIWWAHDNNKDENSCVVWSNVAKVLNMTQIPVLGSTMAVLGDIKYRPTIVLVTSGYSMWMVHALWKKIPWDLCAYNKTCTHLDYAWWRVKSMPEQAIPYMFSLFMLTSVGFHDKAFGSYVTAYIAMALMSSYKIYDGKYGTGSLWCFYVLGLIPQVVILKGIKVC